MELKNYQNIYKMLKTHLYNLIMLNGNKQTSEKVFLKSLKKIQKHHNKKKIEDIIKFGLINSSPIVYLKSIKRKRKQTIEFPFLLKHRSRLSYGIKSILKFCKSKKSISFFDQLNLELINSSKKSSISVENKKKLHQQAFLKKKFANYRWF